MGFLPYRFLKPILGFYFSIFKWIFPSISPATYPPLVAYSSLLIIIWSDSSWNVRLVPPTSWYVCTALRSVVFFYFGNLLFLKPRYLLQYVHNWNSNEVGMPRYFLLMWRTIPSLDLCFAWFLSLWVNWPCKGEKERGSSNIGKFRNKNKHNISPMLIPMSPVYLKFSTASEYLNSASSYLGART